MERSVCVMHYGIMVCNFNALHCCPQPVSLEVMGASCVRLASIPGVCHSSTSAIMSATALMAQMRPPCVNHLVRFEF